MEIAARHEELQKLKALRPRALNREGSLAKTFLAIALLFSLVFFYFKMWSARELLFFAGLSGAAVVDIRQASSSVSQVPDYFETTTDRYPGRVH